MMIISIGNATINICEDTAKCGVSNIVLADIDEVSGRSIWYINSITYPDGSVKFWGKADIFVGEDCAVPDGNDGKWRLSWHGYLNPLTGIIEVDANGVGKEGTVKGMTGKWTYTMNFAVGFFYATEGYIK